MISMQDKSRECRCCCIPVFYCYGGERYGSYKSFYTLCWYCNQVANLQQSICTKIKNAATLLMVSWKIQPSTAPNTVIIAVSVGLLFCKFKQHTITTIHNPKAANKEIWLHVIYVSCLRRLNILFRVLVTNHAPHRKSVINVTINILETNIYPNRQKHKLSRQMSRMQESYDVHTSF